MYIYEVYPKPHFSSRFKHQKMIIAASDSARALRLAAEFAKDTAYLFDTMLFTSLGTASGASTVLEERIISFQENPDYVSPWEEETDWVIPVIWTSKAHITRTALSVHDAIEQGPITLDEAEGIQIQPPLITVFGRIEDILLMNDVPTSRLFPPHQD